MTPAWVIVTGDFRPGAGQGEANHAVARYIAERGGAAVHLVGHEIGEDLTKLAGVTPHRVRRPFGAHSLGQPFLARAGRAVAHRLTAQVPGTRVVVNGGNCRWPDVNWVHMVHAVWSRVDRDRAPRVSLKERAVQRVDKAAERRALAMSRLIIANSRRTRRDLVDVLGIERSRIRVVPLGTDAATFGPVTPDERATARRWLKVPDNRPLVAFVGSLAHAGLKGLDTLLASWRLLCARADWRGELLAAGGGPLGFWRRTIDRLGLTATVRLMGHTDRVPEVLAAADLLVSPSRYDAFGLNVREALCRGVPAITTSQAGVSELYPQELRRLVLPDPEDAQDLADRIRVCVNNPDDLRPAIERISAELRTYTWRHMAERMVREIEAGGP
jgi:glycosyltransferase involved in cell wall biosynthesis